MNTITDFVRADSSNLPKVDTIMLLEFMKSSDKHNVAEIRGAKALISSRQSYVKSAVGYVEVKRGGSLCDVRAIIVPKHKINSKYYIVTVHLDDTEDAIIETHHVTAVQLRLADNTFLIHKKGKYCPHCGKYTIRMSSKYPHCRANWPRRARCHNCEAAVEPERSYCEICGVETARAQRLKRAKMLSRRAKLQKVACNQQPPPPPPKSPDLFGLDPDIEEIDLIESTLCSSDQASETVQATDSTDFSDCDCKGNGV